MLFRRSADLAVKLLGPLVLVALGLAIVRVVVDLWSVFRSPTVASGLDILVSGILSTFVVIELLKSVLDYAEEHRLKITTIVDAATVFILREVMIGLYRRELAWKELLSLSALLLVMGLVRTLAVSFSPAAAAGEREPEPPAAGC